MLRISSSVPSLELPFLVESASPSFLRDCRHYNQLRTSLKCVELFFKPVSFSMICSNGGGSPKIMTAISDNLAEVPGFLILVARV